MPRSLLFVLLLATPLAAADFDGRPWNISTGNLSVTFIQHSPIGAFPQPNYLEPPPSVDALKKMRAAGLAAYEDYFAWGALEREPGKWDWTQHDRVEAAIHAAGLKYVAYTWLHFPPTWLRDQQPADRTLMKCLEHQKETNYLSIFDPRTLDHYDHFYTALKAHFGDKLDAVYACILGPYGEGNYPLEIKDWVNMGHCHEGYWCGDDFAQKAFRAAMQKQYGDIATLNKQWGTTFASFDAIEMPRKPADGKRYWLDFITWYYQSIIDFAGKSIDIVLKHFPKEKVRLKPGGNAGGVNPIAWGTYCPGYAKMAANRGVVLQPADCQGAVFGDKWVGTAYRFYNAPLSTEPAGNLDRGAFIRRMFSDASCGATQFFTYEFDAHAPDIRRYIHLYTGEPGQTNVAVLCPTTLYRLGGDLRPTIDAARKLRDITDFDVLDELLIADGALTPDRYKTLIIYQGEPIDRPILDRIDQFTAGGGRVVAIGPVFDVEGKAWHPAAHLPDLPKTDPPDGVWTTRRANHKLFYNTTTQPVRVGEITVPPHEIAESSFMPSVRPHDTSFRLSTGHPFTPWGFNYDRDHRMRLLEEYWDKEWATVEEDLREMKQLGANVVRIHLQFSQFMSAPNEPNKENLARLAKLVSFCESLNLYLDITGLACYRGNGIPKWYSELDEKARWNQQAAVWTAIAHTCRPSPAIFCYNLMNEPVIADKPAPKNEWIVPHALAGFYYVQRINLDPAGRVPIDIADAWLHKLTSAIRKVDPDHAITAGMLPLAGGGLLPEKWAEHLDYISVHIYPDSKKPKEAMDTVNRFSVGKPLVIEEMFPLACLDKELEKFITESRPLAAGHIGFYWGQTPDELRKAGTIGAALTAAWLDLFQRANPSKRATSP